MPAYALRFRCDPVVSEYTWVVCYFQAEKKEKVDPSILAIHNSVLRGVPLTERATAVPGSR